MVNETIEYIENHISDNITIEELSLNNYLSKHHFYGIFKAITSFTVAEYIQKRRMDLGIQHLLNTNDSILSIALSCGFQSHEVFTRNFKKIFSITPSRFRIERPKINNFDKIDIVEREFVNRYSDITVDFDVMKLDSIRVVGKFINFNVNDRLEISKSFQQVERFALQYIQKENDCLYNVSIGKKTLTILNILQEWMDKL